jgi:pimeloyl-ACP methyl ester carboxylesterase
MSIDSNAGAGQPRRGFITNAARATGAAFLSASLTWIGYSALGIDHDLPLPAAIAAEQRDFTSPLAGKLSYYVDPDGAGRPLVLIHSINAGASAYEMRPLFEHYRGVRPVYALDLPGFGLSDRSNRAYSPALYTAAIVDLLQLEIAAEGGVDLVALSLSAEFAARAALDRPDLVRSLALISPTGFSRPGGQNAVERSSSQGTTDRLYRAFSFPLWSQAFYDLLVSRPSLRYFLQRAFVGPVDRGLLEYAYLTTHRPGARYAPLYFVSGKLFSPDIREAVYERLQQPALVLYDRDANIGFNALPGFLENHLNWHTARIAPTLGLPHWEKLPETTRALDTFWEKDVVETR